MKMSTTYNTVSLGLRYVTSLYLRVELHFKNTCVRTRVALRACVRARVRSCVYLIDKCYLYDNFK